MDEHFKLELLPFWTIRAEQIHIAVPRLYSEDNAQGSYVIGNV